MEETDQFNQMLRQKLSNHQEAVRPEIWSAVSSAISTPVLVSSGISLLTKVLIGAGLSATLIVAGYLIYSSESQASPRPNQQNKEREKVAPLNELKNETISNSGEQQKETPRKIKNEPFTKVGTDEETSPIIKTSEKQLNTIVEQVLEESKSYDPVETAEIKEIDEKIGETEEILDSPVPTKVSEDFLSIDLPNVFTPNGDGRNDFLSIVSEGLSDFSVVVLNGSNEVVFKSSDPNFSWDGKTPYGADAPEGNYLYFFTAKSPKGKILQQSSSLFIQR